MEWRAETAVVATEVNPEGHDHEQVGIPTWEHTCRSSADAGVATAVWGVNATGCCYHGE